MSRVLSTFRASNQQFICGNTVRKGGDNMTDSNQSDILTLLDGSVDRLVSNISLYTKKPTDFSRNRIFNAFTTIKTILNMQGQSLNTELDATFPNMGDNRVSVSAFEQAKDKLSPKVFEDIFKDFNNTQTEFSKLNDMRVFAVDGSDFAVPYNPDSEYVVLNPSGRPRKDGHPVKPQCMVHANLLYDLENRIYQDCILQPRSSMDERTAAITLERLDVGKFLIIADRGYSGLNTIEHLNRIDNCNYLIRTKLKGIKEIASLPDDECDVDMSFIITTSSAYNRLHPETKLIVHPKKSYKEISKTTDYQKWDFDDLTEVKFRVCKFRINEPDTDKEEWEVLITNLDRVKYQLKDMKSLYFKRWSIETSFRALKYNLGAIHFHSKKDNFIQMELFAHLTMFNVVSRSIAVASKIIKIKKSKKPLKYKYAINFSDAVSTVRKYYRSFYTKPRSEMYSEIRKYTHAVKHGIQNKRDLKPKSAIWFVYRVA